MQLGKSSEAAQACLRHAAFTQCEAGQRWESLREGSGRGEKGTIPRDDQFLGAAFKALLPALADPPHGLERVTAACHYP